MAYIFHQDDLPRLISVVPGRERVFFVNKELAGTDDLLAGVMRYRSGAASPYHYHSGCEHFYFILEGAGTVETPEGVRSVEAGTMCFFPADQRHRLRATEEMLYFEFQAPNRFETHILDGTPDDLRWEKRDGKIWVQS